MNLKLETYEPKPPPDYVLSRLPSDVQMQYRLVRESIGLIDRTETGKLVISGPDRFTWLQGMVSNDVRPLDGDIRSLQACVLDATGHILSDMTLIALSSRDTQAPLLGLRDSDAILVDLPRANLENIKAVFDRFLITEDVTIEDVTERMACISLQGPKTRTPEFVANLRATGLAVEADHTGSGGYDVWFDPNRVDSDPEAPDMLVVAQVGPDAQHLLRIEAGIPLYNVDMDETTLAPEAGLMPTHISLKKGCYVGQEIVARIDSRGHTNRALTGLVVVEGDASIPGGKLYAMEADSGETGRETGRITSVTPSSPVMHGKPIAMGYVRHEHRTPGTRLRVTAPWSKSATNVDPESLFSGIVEVVELPFYRNPAA